jgi:hypothetical protein
MNKPDIIDHDINNPIEPRDHDINNPIEPRPYDSFFGIESLEAWIYDTGNYATIAEARHNGAVHRTGLMDMGYSAILDGMGAVRAALECVGANIEELGCEVVVNRYRRFPDIRLSQIDEALSSLIKPNQFNS